MKFSRLNLSDVSVMWSVRLLELAVIHHDDGSLVAADEAGDVLRVGHRGAQHDGVSLGVVADQVEGVGHLALVLEDVDCRRPAMTR